MTTIMRRNPGSFRNPYYPVFKSFYAKNDSVDQNNFAPLNIIKNDHVYKVELNVAGWKKEDIDIKVEDETLIISGERTTENEQEEQYHLKEFSSQRFYRSIILGEEIDQENIQAELKDGILRIELKKLPEEELEVSKKIEIQ